MIIYLFEKKVGNYFYPSRLFATPDRLGRTDNAGMVRVTANPPGLALSPFDPRFVKLLADVAYLLSIHPHINYQPQIDELFAKFADLKIPPPYIPPPAEPFLRMEPSALDFSGTPVGVTVQKTFTLVNYGNGDGLLPTRRAGTECFWPGFLADFVSPPGRRFFKGHPCPWRHPCRPVQD